MKNTLTIIIFTLWILSVLILFNLKLLGFAGITWGYVLAAFFIPISISFGIDLIQQAIAENKMLKRFPRDINQ